MNTFTHPVAAHPPLSIASPNPVTIRRAGIVRRTALARRAAASRRTTLARRSRPPLLCLAVAVLAVTVAACGGAAGTDTGGSASDLTGEYRLVSGSAGGEEIPIVDGHAITLTIEDGDWGGTAACNSYSATVSVADGELTVDEVIRTEKACLEDGVMASENAYLDAFGQVTDHEISGDTLTLRGDDVELVYERTGDVPETTSDGGPTMDPDTPVSNAD